MTEPAAQPAPPHRTWRPMVGWTLGILAALGLAWFIGAVVLPVWKTCRVVAANSPSGKISPDSPAVAVQELGGPERTARLLDIYLQLPDSIADSKVHALTVLGCCGAYGVEPLLRELRRNEAGSRLPLCDARWEVLRNLGCIGPDAAPAVPVLIRTLDAPGKPDVLFALNGNVSYRGMAAWALGRIGPGAAAAVPRLTKMLRDLDPSVRWSARASGSGLE